MSLIYTNGLLPHRKLIKELLLFLASLANSPAPVGEGHTSPTPVGGAGESSAGF
jgi:hypothetical protein